VKIKDAGNRSFIKYLMLKFEDQTEQQRKDRKKDTPNFSD
jgi:hypothetical protein